jgi:hypothetical protein
MLGALVAAPVGAKPVVGYQTGDAPAITLDADLPSGSWVKAIISSGESIGTFRFQGLPDGIGVRPGEAKHTVDAYVVHEETTVPFFGTADFQDASVSKLTLSTKAGPGLGSILASSVALSPDEGFKRFCSASMAGPAEGFSDYTLLANEESNDKGLAVPTGAPYGADTFPGDGTRQGGYAVVLNTETGESTQVAGMGRLNHENTIALPGFDQITMLTTDDTFNRPSAQVYMYLADDQDAVFNDEGTLWAFRVTGKNGSSVDPADAFNGANDYNDVQSGDDLTGEFIAVPGDIARGTTSDFPQDALEDWSNENNVFQFVRAEDIAYDKNNPRVVYMADTGGGQIQPDSTTGRLFRDRSQGDSISPNGAIFRFEFSDDDAKVVDSFTKLAQGDDNSQANFVPFVSPDNIDTSKKSLMVQEDNDDAKVWQLRLRQGDWRVVATVNDSDGESSGIVDVSEWFGGGTWLLDVQGHGATVPPDSVDPDTGVRSKLETGQLLLMKIPGS